MIFFELFYVFSKIGIFNFGGGYAMLSLIQNEVVEKHHWLTVNEFTDIVAISQSTPGPIGINCATYTGYTAVFNELTATGMDHTMCMGFGVLGALIASLSIIWLPFILMISISKFLLRNKDSKGVQSVFGTLRPAIVGLLAAASMLLMTKENFGSPNESMYVFIVSILLFIFSFFGTRLYKINPILMIVMCGVAGLIIY